MNKKGNGGLAMEEKEKHRNAGKGRTSRRDFLKGAITATAGGLITLPGSVISKPGLVMAQSRAYAQEKPKEPEKALFKNLMAERRNCTGCRACEYACTLKHEKTVRPAVSAVHIQRYWGIIDVVNICWQCPDPVPCIAACPTTPVAIKRDPKHNGITFIDNKTCLGGKCNKCIEACPPQFLRRHPDTGWPIFCDSCEGDPECVKACKMQASNIASCLRAERMGSGVGIAYQEVKGADAAKDLLMDLFYPSKGGR
jgi:Fe-S-cluster-containing hydrogenase component 2